MHITSSVGPFAAGLLAGIALTLSCSDDSPSTVDAATCDCPAAEPPVTGRVTVVNGTQIIPANSDGGQSAGCPQGAQMLTGSCTADTPTGYDVTLQQSGFYRIAPGSWNCMFRNNEPIPVTIKVSVICLAPAS